MLEQLLVDIGLTHKEAVVYLTNYALGTQCATVIAQKCGFKRTTTHLVLKRLITAGFVSLYIQNKTQFFTAVSPKKILQCLEEKKSLMEKNQQNFEAALGDFQGLMSPYSVQPKVSFFSGVEGIKTVMEDTLSARSEILCYSILDGWFSNEALKKFALEYARKRIKTKKIHLRAIDTDTVLARDFLGKEYPRNSKLTESRWLPKHFIPFTNEVNIYDDKLAIVSLDPKEYFGIILESQSIASMQRTIFNLAWMSALPNL